MAAMDVGKRMMEKWGWSKGQGLGKDNKGMTSCLILRKNDGSANQGRIEQSAPMVVEATGSPAFSKAAPVVPPETINKAPAAPKRGLASQLAPAPKPLTDALSSAAAALCVQGDTAAASAAASAAAALSQAMPADEEPARKRRKSKWDPDEDEAAGHMAEGQPTAAEAVNSASLAKQVAYEYAALDKAKADAEARLAEARLAHAFPRTINGVAADGRPLNDLGLPLPGSGHDLGLAPGTVSPGMAPGAMPGAMFPPSPMMVVPGATASTMPGTGEMGSANLTGSSPAASSVASAERVTPAGSIPLGEGTPTVSEAARPKKSYQRQWWVRDDWRWSKGYEALRAFEELQIPPRLTDLAKKVLGGNSRFPARIADDTDCLVELSAWGTIILRPRGSGADVVLAKKMLYAVMHPSQKELQTDVLFYQDLDAEAAINDSKFFMDGVDEKLKQAKTFEFSVEKMVNGAKLKRVGLGAEKVAAEDAALPSRMERKEILLPTTDDIALAKAHMSDLRIATGVQAVLHEDSMIVFGKEKGVQRAEQLMNTLLETGEWVALTESFVVPEDLKAKKEVDDGPSEQILIKVAEGKATELIGKHLKAMERAAQADKLKLSTRPIAGKRTLMVDGTRKAHERVKLMAKELAEKGESPMLTKAIAVEKWGPKEEPEEETSTAGSKASTAPARAPAASSALDKPATPGVISAAAVIHVKEEVKDEEPTVKEEPKASAPKPARPAMRHMPPPRLAAAMAAGTDLFAGLPKPEPVKIEDDEGDDIFSAKEESGEKSAASVAAKAEDVTKVEPVDVDIFAGLPASGSATVKVESAEGNAEFPPKPPGLAGMPSAAGPEAADLPKQIVEMIELASAAGQGVTE